MINATTAPERDRQWRDTGGGALAEAKRSERGDAALNETDRQHLQRAKLLASECELLHAKGTSALDIPSTVASDDLTGLATWLSQHGVRLNLIDLTRSDIAVPAVRVVAEELQPYTSDVTTDRLARSRSAGRGKVLPPGPVALM